MRPSWCWLLSALLASGLGGGRAVALDFHDSIGGWSITLPDGASPMSEVERADIVETLKQSIRTVNLTTAFNLSNAALPYVLVTVHHVKNASLKRVAKSAEAAPAKFVDRPDVRFDVPAVHEAMKMVLVESRSEESRSLVALFPGRDVVVELTVVMAADAPESDFAAFRAITSSFRFDAGRGYAPKSDASDPLEKVLLMCCGIVAIRLIVAKLRGRPRNPLEPEDSPEKTS